MMYMESDWWTTRIKVIREVKRFLCKRYEMRKQIKCGNLIYLDNEGYAKGELFDKTQK